MSPLRRWTFYAGLLFPVVLVVLFYAIETSRPMLVRSWQTWVIAFALFCLGAIAGMWKWNKPFALGVLFAAPVTTLATAALLVWAFAQNTVR